VPEETGTRIAGKVELALAWQRVESDLRKGALGADVDPGDRAEVASRLKDAQDAARDEVWAGYRFVVIADAQEPDGLRAGHASAGETLCGRIIAALRSDGRLSESPGASYLERNWPPALEGSGAWPLESLRKSFFDGSLTRLPDPDSVLLAAWRPPLPPPPKPRSASSLKTSASPATSASRHRTESARRLGAKSPPAHSRLSRLPRLP